MGSSKSKPITPNNPLQELQLKEILRDQKLKKKEKEQKNLRKIQEKNIKKQQKQQKHQKPNDHVAPEPQPNYDLNQQEYEQKIEQSLRYQLDNDLCGFILNQTSFTLQFFGNFEQEISAAYEYITKKKENKLNQQFEEHSILMANALDAAVERRVKYRPIHGPEKYHMQPLQPQTMYVVFENIDIARPNEANYDSLSPICKVDMETDFYKNTPCSEEYAPILKNTKWKGYVRLKLRDTQLDNTQKAVASQKPPQNEEGIYFATESTISSSSRRKEEIRHSNSSGYTSGPEYDYAYITHLNSHHPLAELTMTNNSEKAKVDTKVLPESCIANFQDFIEIRDDDEEEEEEEGYEFNDDDPSNIDGTTYSKFNYPQVKYLNSKEFMRYFGDLLRRKLAPKLGLTASDFEGGTYRGASIHTQTYEIIPAIHVAHNAQNWPDCAFQFKRRTRPTRTNPLTRKQFQWPTQDMIKRIETFGFHVIPLGHAPKRQRNPYREIEWKIIFPKAERFLETTLTNTQIKVFMIAKALVKAFVEPQEKDNTLMFTIDHLRMHLFWECERNYVTWPEEFLGDVLLRFIKTFMMRLREKSLPDFFIQGRNLFESIPEYSLVRLHSALAEIVSNPVMHLIVALRNLYFVEEFIPKMDFKKIYSNLVENNYLKLKTLSRNAKSLSIPEDKRVEIEEDPDIKGLIGYSQQKDKGRGQLRRRTLMMKHNIEMRRKLDYEKNRKSVDSIDLEFVFAKNLKDSEKKKDYNQGVENLRKTNILEIILDNLIAMGETCTAATETRSIYLARIYLNQAKRLCKFYSNYGCDMGAIEYISQIETIESQIAILRNTESNIPPPALPIRTSLEPVKSFRTKDSSEVKETRGNLYVRQVSRAKSESPKLEREPRRSIKFVNPFEIKPSIQVKADVHRRESVKQVQSDEEVCKQPRRSIKFSDEAPSPTHIFRFDDDEPLQWCEKPEPDRASPQVQSKSHAKQSSKPTKPLRKPRYTSNSSDSDTDYEENGSTSDLYSLKNPHWEGSRPVSINRQTDSSKMSSPNHAHSQSPPIIYRFEIHQSPSKSSGSYDSLHRRLQKSKGSPYKDGIFCNDTDFANPKLSQVEVIPHTPTTILRFENGRAEVDDVSKRLPSTVSTASSIQAPTTFEGKRALIKKMLQKKTEGLILVNGVENSETSDL